MTNPAAPTKTWGTANVGMTAEWFHKRVGMCRSVEHLRAALEQEAQRETPRRERIATLNQQAKRIKRLDQ